MSPRFAALVLLASVVVAGCIQPSSAVDPSSPPPSTHNEGGNMTASEQRTNATCSGTGGSGQQACASRRIAVSGSLSGIAKMDVDVHTFNGHVSIKQGAASAWTLTAVLKAYGATQEEANANLEKVSYAWRHTDGTSHFVQAEAKKESNDNFNAEVQIDATLPATVVMVVTAGTTNGAITIEGKTDGLSADTLNGQIDIHADVTSVSMKTTNGQVDAKLRPTASGRISASTVNGEVTLTVPEDAQHGYDAEAKTVNGDVSIGLKDGAKDTSACPTGSQYYTPPCNDLKFHTKDYAARAIQTSLVGEASNGAIEIKSG